MKPILIATLTIISIVGLGFSADLQPTPSATPTTAENNRADLAALREVMQQRVESQKVLAEETSDWKLGREMLQQRIQLVGQEIAEMQKKKTDSEKSITEADLKKSDLLKNQASLEASLKQLQDEIAKYEDAIRPLKAWLPSVVLEKVDPLYQRIPDAGKESKISLAERYQNVIGILNQLNKSNGEINIVSEIRTLSDGKPAEVKTLYVGLAQAYYVNATGKKGGSGYPTETGWVWKEDDNVASKIQTAIGMLESKTKAQFVAVPVQIKK